MSGFTLTYDDWNTEHDLFCVDATEAMGRARMMAEERVGAGSKYASVTVRRDSDGRRVFHCDNT